MLSMLLSLTLAGPPDVPRDPPVPARKVNPLTARIPFKLPPLPNVVKPDVQAWLRLPANVGSCPCKATGGCHCRPHSECARGNCAAHNPLLNAQALPNRSMQRQFCPT